MTFKAEQSHPLTVYRKKKNLQLQFWETGECSSGCPAPTSPLLLAEPPMERGGPHCLRQKPETQRLPAVGGMVATEKDASVSSTPVPVSVTSFGHRPSGDVTT